MLGGLHGTHDEESQDPQLLLERRALADEQRQRDEEHEEVEDHVDGRVALVGADELRRHGRPVAVARGARRRAPEASNGKTGDPGDEGVGDAPERGEDDDDEGEAPHGVAPAVDAQVLEQQGLLDKGRRRAVGRVADVKSL